jgi:hypothetical protein
MKQNILLYNGAQYYISVKIFAPNSQVEYDNISAGQFDILAYDNIEKIEFENDISNSLLIGEIIYSDNSNSVLDKFLNISCAYINIDIKKLKNVNTASTNSLLDIELAFEHTFIITSIDKINQDDDIIDYKIRIVSNHWWNFNSNITYSTHNNTYNNKESPVDVLSNIYSQCGIPLNRNDITSNNLIHFMSHAGDNLSTSQLYILKRTYNIEDLNNPGFVKVVYDCISNRYSLWALNQHSGDIYKNNIYKNYTQDQIIRNTITVPIYNKYMDSLQNQKETVLNIVNFNPNSLNYNLFSDYRYWSYDYLTNTFKNRSIANKQIIESLPYLKNNVLLTNKKYYEIDTMLSKKQYSGSRIFSRQSSQWDQTHWPYDDIDQVLLNNGILSVTTAGNLLRKPGDNTFLMIDSTDYSSIMNLKGDWINMRVVHTFGPKMSSYTNTILLSRLNISTEDKTSFIKKLK